MTLSWKSVLPCAATAGAGAGLAAVAVGGAVGGPATLAGTSLAAVGFGLAGGLAGWWGRGHFSRPAADVHEQLTEVERLLGELDRRSFQARAGRPGAPGPRLRHVLGSLSRAAGSDLQRILTCIDQIDHHIRQMTDGAEIQSDAVGQTTTSVEQMSSHIDSISQNAGAAHEATLAARESAAAGLELVRELIRNMERISLHVKAGAKKLEALGERSQEIGSIIETIGTISAHTDMLALNASIESVRAGEHGRGFAVVAEEVRKLAEKAAHATREVTSLIESMQLETHDSISAMADQQAQVETEVRRVNEAGVALERISQTSSDSADRVGEISRATLHQFRLTQEVVQAMQRISEVARSVHGTVDGVSDTTKSLKQLAHQLNASLGPLRRCAGPGGSWAPAAGSQPPAGDNAPWRAGATREASSLAGAAASEDSDAALQPVALEQAGTS